MVLKEKSLINDYCNSTEEILKFFSDVCIIDHQEEDTIRGCFENSGKFSKKLRNKLYQ